MRKFLLVIFFVLVSNLTSAKVFAVIVGVEEYDKSVPNLTASVDDAMKIYNLYNNGKNEINLLKNNQATLANIMSAMSIFKKAKETDTIIFYFSGHGTQGAFAPHDVAFGKNALYYSEIKNAFKTSKAKIKLCIVDACYSGGLSKSKKDAPTTSLQGSPNIILFMSSRNYQTSIESTRMNAGFFTYYFVNGIKGKADANNDKQITAYELYSYVKQNVVISSNKTQSPTMIGKFNKELILSKY